MKVFKPLIPTIILFSAFSYSCTKTVEEHVIIIETETKTINITDTIYDLKDGLIAYYNFVNGNLNDSSGHSNNIAFNNATMTADRFGNANSAYRFAQGNYMRVSNSSSLSPTHISMMAVVRFNGFYTGSAWGTQVFMKGPSDQSQGIYGIRTHPISYDLSQPIDTSTEIFTPFYGDYALSISDNSDYIVSGTWYTVIYTFDGIQSKIYLNGVLKNTLSQQINFNANSNDLYIGKTENTVFPYYFSGDVDEIRIYNKALSPLLVDQLSKLKY